MSGGASTEGARTPSIRERLSELTGGGDRSLLARGAAIVFVVSVGGMGVGYLSRILLARWMGLTEFGIYSWVMATASLVVIPGVLGWPRAVIRFVPEFSAHEQWGRVRGVIRSSSWMAFAGSSAVCGLGTLVLLATDAPERWIYGPAMLVGIWMVPLLALTKLHAALARSVQRIALAQVPVGLLQPLLVLGLVALFYAWRGDLDSTDVIVCTIVALLLVFVLQRALFVRGLPETVRSARAEYDIRGWMRVSIPLSLIGVFTTILNSIDLVMLGSLAGPESAGIYSAAVRTSHVIGLFLTAVNMVAAPLYASLHARSEHARLQQLVHTTVHWAFWPSLAAGIVVVALGEPILGLFGPEFTRAHGPLAILVAGSLVSTSLGSVLILMAATGHHDVSARVLGWSALLNVALNALLIPPFGIMGAAVATAITSVIWKTWLERLARSRLGIRTSLVSALTAGRRSQP